MKKLTETILLFLMILVVLSCNSNSEKVEFVQSKQIANFSDLNYAEAPEHPYFSEIDRLPIGFSLEAGHEAGSILYLTESANTFPFDDANLEYFLTPDELKQAFETFVDSTSDSIRVVRYYPYESLVTENYVLLIINKRRYDLSGRYYQFDIRTYTFDGELISILPLAKWDYESGIYFGGWIMPGMHVKREFDNGKLEYFKIQQNGDIIEKA